MDRAMLRNGSLLTVMALVALVATAGGCRGLLATVAYIVKGTDVEADFKGLQGKKVAVVCRPASTLTFGNPTVASELARQVGLLLQTRVPKIKVIDHQKVAQWTDAHEWREYAEVGKALKADLVVGIDLQEFSTYQSQTLYQGKASVSVTVYDCREDGKVVFEKALPQALYPPNTGIAASDQPERQFRRKFIRVLADQIGRHFYTHDAHADFAQDADAL
jgi:hypothetical protein